MHEPDIFISYSREDATAARRFADAFANEGFDVWWDAALRSGENFDEVIEKALRAAKAVVVLWSPRSVASRWVRAEATLADRNGTLAPVIIELCDRPIIFELTHTANLCHWTGDTADGAWRIFVQDVQRLVEIGRPGGSPTGPSGTRPAGNEPARPHGGVRPPSAQPAIDLAGAAGADAFFSKGKVESLISALSSFHDAMTKSNGQVAEEADEFEQTQIFTRSDELGIFRGDEFHCLEMSIADEPETRYIVSPLGLKIGRTAPADVILADTKVSRSHCKVELKNNELYVLDLNSTNGTFVDGERIAGSTVLPLGSTLTVGNNTLIHELRRRADV